MLATNNGNKKKGIDDIKTMLENIWRNPRIIFSSLLRRLFLL